MEEEKISEAINTVTSTTLWSLCLLRNDFVFQGRKMAKYTLCLGSGRGYDQAVETSMYRGPGCSSFPVLKAFGSSKMGVAQDRLEWLNAWQGGRVVFCVLQCSCVPSPPYAWSNCNRE